MAAGAFAQRGDKDWEEQGVLPEDFRPPASPPLSPADALKSFDVAPGFSIELFAAEPLIEEPVVLQFGPAGRLWVVEMRSFMPDVDGNGEEEAIGRVCVLEDTDGDGRADKRTTFLDNLVCCRERSGFHAVERWWRIIDS